MGQEEVGNATGHHTVGEAIQGLERSWPPVKTVPILTLLQQQLKLERVSKHIAAYLAHGQRNHVREVTQSARKPHWPEPQLQESHPFSVYPSGCPSVTLFLLL